MDQFELRNILSSKFEFDQWQSILSLMFSKIEYFTSEVAIDASLVKSGGQIGNIRLDDGRSLAIFKFEVVDNIIISRNRKGLREIAAHYVDQSLIHGAWVFYYSQNQRNYRLTYIAKQTFFSPNGELIKSETAPKRYTFLLGENEMCTTAASRLYELISKNKKGTVYLTDVTDAFSVERLNKEFFAGYKLQYKKFLDYRENDNKDNRDYVKKLLGRLVFLQFLQKKGWMGIPADNDNWNDGDKNYLSNLVERYDGNDRLLSDVLESLFFETLNEPRTNNMAKPILGKNIKIPYLNGGLFDKDRLDHLDIDFPYTYFKDLMTFFSMYNFTIDENDPDDAEVGIDPEMLGHIFENLLEDNKNKGAFYTPKEIVQYMSRESIIQYLKTNTNENLHPSIELLVKSGKISEELQEKSTAIQINSLLQQVKVCDPAIGSGAFPMGVLNVLFHCRQLIYGFTKGKNDFSPAKIKREIIQENIYGVDIEQGAVDIARLRFWLSLVVDENDPQPLPNLDYKIMCGNSLLNRFALDVPFENTLKSYNQEHKTNYTLKDYKEWVNDYTNESDHNKKDIFKEKIAEIKGAFRTELGKELILKRSKLENKISMLESPTLFGEPDKEKVKKAKELRKTLNEMLQAEKNIINNKLYENAFEWRFEFPSLLDDEGVFIGFDIVIGNPPYVSTKGVDDDVKKEFLKIYNFSDDTYNHFFFRGNTLLKEKGNLTYIIPKTFWTTQTKRNLRDLLLSKQINYIYDTANPFETAMVDTCIASIVNDKFNDNHNINFLDGSKDLSKPEIYSIKQSVYKNTQNSVIFKPTERNLRVYELYGQSVKDLYNKWWDKIETSKKIAQNKTELEAYRMSLKPGDITLLGALTEGGVGLQTGNNGKYIAVRKSTKWAANIVQSRPKKLDEAIKKYNIPTSELENLSIQEFLLRASEIEIAEKFETLKEKYGRDIFGQGYIYRLIDDSEVVNVDELTQDEKENGIDISKNYYVPYDKGDKDGNRWFLETPFAIAWSKENVRFLKTNSGKKGAGMPVVRNPQFNFKEGFCWNNVLTTFIRCRKKQKTVQSTESMSFFSMVKFVPEFYMIIIMNSSYAAYYIDCFVNSTSHCTTGDAKLIPILIPSEKQLDYCKPLFDRIVSLKQSVTNCIATDEDIIQEASEIENKLNEFVDHLYSI